MGNNGHAQFKLREHGEAGRDGKRTKASRGQRFGIEASRAKKRAEDVPVDDLPRVYTFPEFRRYR